MVCLLKKLHNMQRLEKTQKFHRRQHAYDVRRYSAKRKKLRGELFVSEKVFVL